MGADMSLISSLLFPGYRRRVLGLLLLHPESRYHVREIARITHTVPGSLHRELSKLAEAQILIRENTGNQVYYRANPACLIFEELMNILQKTSGLKEVLENALAPLSKKIDVAFVFGSIARGKENTGSDIDILIIGNISFVDAVTALHPAQNIVGREINPKIYRMAEWQKLLDNKNSFAEEILNSQKLFILGGANDLN